ncbi:diguanylate cyclase domain-containing protein [Komagataeibacter rhaeticus]
MISKQDGNRQFAIFMLDIDRFRDINDALGHVHADQFLVEIAARIRCHCRVMTTCSAALAGTSSWSWYPTAMAHT